MIGLASAVEENEYQYFRLGEPSQFLSNCFLNDLPCPDTINCSITIYSPKNNTLINNVPIDYDGYLFNFPLSASDNSQIGCYQASIYCNNGATFLDKFAVSYCVTPNGTSTTTAQGIMYGAIIFLLMALFTFLTYIYFGIETANTRNEDGNIININYKKYLKFFVFMIGWIILIGISYFAWNLSYAILQFTEMANFFYFIFRLSYILLLPLFIVVVTLMVIRYVQDNKIKEMLMRNLTVK
jgi:hypothetical protein